MTCSENNILVPIVVLIISAYECTSDIYVSNVTCKVLHMANISDLVRDGHYTMYITSHVTQARFVGSFTVWRAHERGPNPHSGSSRTVVISDPALLLFVWFIN